MRIYFFSLILFILIPLSILPQNYRWAKNVGGTYFENGGGITTDEEGNVFIIGMFSGSNVDFDPGPGTAFLSSQGGLDIFFAKYDSSGNFIWAKSLGGTSDDFGLRIISSSEGSIYIGGWYASVNVDFDPGPGTCILSAEANPNLWFAKFNNDGTFVWAKSTGGAWMAGIHDIYPASGGDLLITGYFCGTDVNFNPGGTPINLSSIGNSGDIFFARYDAAGECIFAKSCSGPAYEVGNSIRTDPAGNIYVFGPFGSSVDFDPGTGIATLSSAGQWDIFIAKYTSAGDYIRADRIGGPGNDNSGGIAVKPDGSYWISASFSGTGVDFDPGSGTALLNSNGGSDIAIAYYGEDGSFRWAGSTGGIEDDLPMLTFLDKQNNVYQAGIFKGQNVDFDPGPGICTLTSAGGYDFYFSRFTPAGKFMWAGRAGGSADDVCTFASADSAGNIYLTGSFSGIGIDFDPGTGTSELNSNGASDIFFAKYSRDVLNPFLGLAVPDTIPVRFGTPNIISNGEWWWHGFPVFSPEGNEMYFVKYLDAEEMMVLYEMDNVNGVWSEPFRPSFSSDSSDNSPVFYSNGNRLMFTSKRSGAIRIYSVGRIFGGGWSSPEEVSFDYSALPHGIGAVISLAENETLYFDSFTSDNSMHIFKADTVSGTYSNIFQLPNPPNSQYSEGTMQIAPDQSYIIYDSNRPGLGLHDLYVSFKNQDDTWSPSQNFGSPINGSHEEVFPGLSPDGKYMFFISLKPGDLGYNPYWVSSRVIDFLNPLEVIDDNRILPDEMKVEQNYPNPFNPITYIRFSIPQEVLVNLSIYDILGAKVKELKNEVMGPGYYRVEFNASDLASGVYFYRIKATPVGGRAGDFIQTKKMILLK